LQIRFRHPEVGSATELISTALIQPYEAYRNGRGGVHALRFKHVAKPIGEATNDGLAVFFYEDGESLVGLELLDVEPFM